MMKAGYLEPCGRCHRHHEPAKLYAVRGAMICADCGEKEIAEYKAMIEENRRALTKPKGIISLTSYEHSGV